MSKILIVEDESDISELIALHLRHAGHEVELAADALEVIAQSAAYIDRMVRVVLQYLPVGHPASESVSYVGLAAKDLLRLGQ